VRDTEEALLCLSGICAEINIRSLQVLSAFGVLGLVLMILPDLYVSPLHPYSDIIKQE
jgi:hypothetical protein